MGRGRTPNNAAAAAASPSVPLLLRALEQSLLGRPWQQEEDGNPQQQQSSSGPHNRRRRLGSAALVGYGALLAGALEGKRRSRRPPPPPSHSHRRQAEDDGGGRTETLLRGLRVCSVGLRARRAFDAADALDLLAERLLLLAPPPPQKEKGEGSVAAEAALTVLLALARPYDDLEGASAPAVGRLGRALLLARARDGGGAVLRAAYQGGKEVGEVREHCIRQMDEWIGGRF